MPIPNSLSANRAKHQVEGLRPMEPISEERCISSGRWPERDRWALRDTIEILPLEDDRVCDACFSAVGRWPKKPSVWQGITRPPYGPLVQAAQFNQRPAAKTPKRQVWGTAFRHHLRERNDMAKRTGRASIVHAQDIESTIQKLVAEGIARERISVEDIRGYAFVMVDRTARVVFRRLEPVPARVGGYMAPSAHG